MTARTVVTGIGVITPNGLDASEYWTSTLAGRSGIDRIDRTDLARFAHRTAGHIKGFDDERRVPGRLLPQTDRVTRLALAATDEALADAGIPAGHFHDYGMGVVTSNATGGFEFTHTEIHKLWTKGPDHVSVYESFAWFYAVNTGQISIRHGLKGPSAVIVSEQAGGLDAIGHARRTIRSGTKASVTGGMESSFDPWGWACHLASGRTSTNADSRRAFRPFDVDADGAVPGEGGAILILEDETSALDRQAPRIYGEIAGYAATFDPATGSDRPPALAAAAQRAITDAKLTAADIDVVFADAAGTPHLDRIEAQALRDIFGPHGVPVTAPKSLIGRLCSGGAPVDVVTALLAIQDGLIPPTFGTVQPAADYQLDLVLHEPRTGQVRTALVLARGIGGFNAAVVVRGINNPRRITTQSTIH